MTNVTDIDKMRSLTKIRPRNKPAPATAPSAPMDEDRMLSPEPPDTLTPDEQAVYRELYEDLGVVDRRHRLTFLKLVVLETDVRTRHFIDTHIEGKPAYFHTDADHKNLNQLRQLSSLFGFSPLDEARLTPRNARRGRKVNTLT